VGIGFKFYTHGFWTYTYGFLPSLNVRFFVVIRDNYFWLITIIGILPLTITVKKFHVGYALVLT
jgi:hypothetical protein